MLRVVILDIPYGIEHNQKQIGMINIINDGQHSDRPEWGSYRIEDSSGKKLTYIDNHFRGSGFCGLLELVFQKLKGKKVGP